MSSIHQRVDKIQLAMQQKHTTTPEDLFFGQTAQNFPILGPHFTNTVYRKISNIRRTESPNLNVSRLVLQLSLPNPMKPGVKSRMKM